jgi:hypothetical protein
MVRAIQHHPRTIRAIAFGALLGAAAIVVALIARRVVRAARGRS